MSISLELAAELLFGTADEPVEIVAAIVDEHQRCLIVEIKGLSVPDSELVTAMVERKTNRAGQSLDRLTFLPVP